MVYSQHQSRQLFIELQGLQARRDELNIDWESLKLEESTLNTALMVDQAAHDRCICPTRPGQRGVRQAMKLRLPSYKLTDLGRLTRPRLVLGLLLLAAVGILCRAVYLQLIAKDFLQEQGNDRYLRTVAIPAHRGMVLDRNGEPLAVSSPVDSLWAVPEALLENPAQLPRLAQALGLKAGELEQRLSDREGREFCYLRRHLAPDLAQRVLALQLPGVYSQREYRRYYPTAEITSHFWVSPISTTLARRGWNWA